MSERWPPTARYCGSVVDDAGANLNSLGDRRRRPSAQSHPPGGFRLPDRLENPSLPRSAREPSLREWDVYPADRVQRSVCFGAAETPGVSCTAYCVECPAPDASAQLRVGVHRELAAFRHCCIVHDRASKKQESSIPSQLDCVRIQAFLRAVGALGSNPAIHRPSRAMQKQQSVAAGLIGDDPTVWIGRPIDDDWFRELIRGRRSVRRYRPELRGCCFEKLLTAQSGRLRPIASPEAPPPNRPTGVDRIWRADLRRWVDAALVERRVHTTPACTGAPALSVVEEMDDSAPPGGRMAQSTGPGPARICAAHARLLECAPLFVPDLVRDARPAGQLASPVPDHAPIRRRREAARALHCRNGRSGAERRGAREEE